MIWLGLAPKSITTESCLNISAVINIGLVAISPLLYPHPHIPTSPKVNAGCTFRVLDGEVWRGDTEGSSFHC